MKDKKYIIIRKEHKIISVLFHGSRLVHVSVENEDRKEVLGNIYIAKVKNLTANINAAFLEIEPGFTCFLPLNEARRPIIVNRAYDGRIIEGDELVIQLNKEAVKTKPPAATSILSLSGKYCAVSFGKPGIAYSGKLSSKARLRLKNAMEAEPILLPKGFGLVIRTNSKDLMDYTPLKKEAEELIKQMEDILGVAWHRTCFSVLYRKPAAYITNLRDMYEGQCDEVVTDEADIYDNIRQFGSTNPSFALPEIRLYQDNMLPLYKLYAVETRLQEALSKKVWLKSGGYLIIEPTEALTVIDVNSGKIAAKKDKEATFFNINMEAAEEIAIQLALRNISGIIIVDFINMEKDEHNKQLLSALGDLLKKDSVRTTLAGMTTLGLVEITRMKTSKPLREQL